MDKIDKKRFDGESFEELIPKLVEEFKIRGRITNAPFGFLSVDVKCTFCGLCVDVCPRNALTMVVDGDNIKLKFNHILCVGCGLCKRICPERAIEIEHILNFENLDAVLATDWQVYCVSCNNATWTVYKQIG